MTATVIALDLLVTGNADALRRLPPWAQLGQPSGELAGRLLHDFRQHSGDLHPVAWLQQNRERVTGVLALALLVDFAGPYQGMASKATALGAAVDEVERSFASDYEPLYGGLVTARETGSTADIPWVEKVHSTDDMTDLLLALEQLKRRAALQPKTSPDLSLRWPGRETLLADLLSLSDNTNAVEWLIEERFDRVARLVLEFLVQESTPRMEQLRDAESGSKLHAVLKPGVKNRLGRFFTVRVEQIRVLESHFSIRTKATYQLPGWHPQPAPGEFMSWDGFNRVQDNNGFGYVLKLIERERSKKLWWWREYLTIACWPALVDGSTLILEASPVALSYYQPPPLGKTLVTKPTPPLGEVRLSVSLS
jgi:hypothetical protein